MKELVVDTSVWIQAFRGISFPILDQSLKEGRVTLPPLVLAELLSGVKNQKQERKLIQFLGYIPLHPAGRAHWKKVGLFRGYLKSKGLTVSIPDCHIAQCTLELQGTLLTTDKIFKKIAPLVGLDVF